MTAISNDENRSSQTGCLVSVVIPTYRRPAPLDAALGSVASQEHSNVEVVIVNDGGPSVASVASAWDDALSVKLVELTERTGPAHARNVGVDKATGDYLAFLDDDDLFLPNHLALGCGPLDHNKADFVYLGAAVAERRLDSAAFARHGPHFKAYPFDSRLLDVVNFLHTGSVIVRTFRESPIRFDENLDVCEDWDLWLALTRSFEYRAKFVETVTSVYHQIADAPGLVAEAQLTSPSKFSVARDYIYHKWPSNDPLVLELREWMSALEAYRDSYIKKNGRTPNLLFDDILAYVDQCTRAEQPADYSLIKEFFLQ